MSEKAAALCAEGLELMTQHHWEEAEEKMWLAVIEDNQSPELWYNLGKCRFHQDKFEDAIKALSAAIHAKYSHMTEANVDYPVGENSYPEAWALLGSCHYAIHDLDAAYSSFGSAASHYQQAKNYPAQLECLTARAHAVLAKGEDYQFGFSLYTQRLHYKDPDTWDGNEPLRGKTLLVKAEGGLGDQIFFARYLSLIHI